jgi:GNAT superfamily N-acetyltransferase
MIDEQPLLKTRYTFESGTGDLENDRYITHIEGEIFVVHYKEKETMELIGKFQLKLVHIALAINTGYPIYDICDSSQMMISVMFSIWDLEEDKLVPEIKEVLGDDIDAIADDILIIDTLQIVKKYRGLGLAQKVLKDIYMRFEDAVALFVAEVFPLQIDDEILERCNEEEKDFYAKMDYQGFKGNRKSNINKIKKMYKSIGFSHIPLTRTDRTFMFSATCNVNKKMMALKLE